MYKPRLRKKSSKLVGILLSVFAILYVEVSK